MTSRLQDRGQGRRNPSASASVELPAISWRNRMTSHSELLPIWDILERITPDKDTRSIQEEIAKVRADVDAGNMARRIRHWQLTSGFHTDQLLRIVAKEGLGVDTLTVKNHPHLLRSLMDLPLVDLNLTAGMIAQMIHTFTDESSPHYSGSQLWIDSAVHIDRGITALNLTAALIDRWSIGKQIEEAKAALKPVEGKDERAALVARVIALRKEIALADATKQGKQKKGEVTITEDLEQLDRLKKLLLLEVRLYPQKNQQLAAVLKEALSKLETKKKNADAGAKRAALVLGVDVSQIILTAVEPSGLAAKVVGLAWKTYNAKPKLMGFVAGISHIQHHREEKTLAKRAIRQLKSRERNDSDRALLATVEKVHRVYWSHQTSSLTSELLLKSMGLASSILGISTVLIKVLAIIGVIAAAGAVVAGIGYATLVLAGAALLIRLICYIYQHRNEIELYLKKTLMVIRKAFYELSIRVNDKKSAPMIGILRDRIKKIDTSLATYHLTNKLSGIAPELIQELGERLAAVQPHKLEGVRKAQLAIQAITGKSAHYLETSEVKRVGLSQEEIVDRSLVSLIAQLGAFDLSNIKAHRRRREDSEEVEREALVPQEELEFHDDKPGAE